MTKHKPIAALIRAKSTAPSKKVNSVSGVMTLEEQIAALENDLGNSSSDEGSAGDADSGSDSEAAASLLVEEDASGNVVKYVSSLAAERIVPLSKQYLPAADCGGSKNKRHQESEPLKAKKRAIRFADEDGKAGQAGAAADGDKKKARKDKKDRGKESKQEREGPRADSGMEKTIREMLQQYEPSSAERRPFWCRICKFQGQDKDELMAHRQSDFHKAASKMELKMSSCQLCRKQFTSPHQLKEHVQAKAHKERLERVKAANARNSKFR